MCFVNYGAILKIHHQDAENYLIAGIFCSSLISFFSFSFLVERILSKRRRHSLNATCTKWLLRMKIKQTKSLVLLRTNIFRNEIHPLYGMLKTCGKPWSTGFGQILKNSNFDQNWFQNVIGILLEPFYSNKHFL